MKKYLIEWETDFCDNFPERSGECVVEAETEKEAAEKFYDLKIPKSIIMNIQEERK